MQGLEIIQIRCVGSRVRYFLFRRHRRRKGEAIFSLFVVGSVRA